MIDPILKVAIAEHRDQMRKAVSHHTEHKVKESAVLDAGDQLGLQSVVALPAAPALASHDAWPFPGLTGRDTAQSLLSHSSEYIDLLCAIVNGEGGGELTAGQVLSKVPEDWRDALGKWAHGFISQQQAELHQIQHKFVSHDGGGHHYTYKAQEAL